MIGIKGPTLLAVAGVLLYNHADYLNHAYAKVFDGGYDEFVFSSNVSHSLDVSGCPGACVLSSFSFQLFNQKLV